jgi:copper transport protein
VAALTALVLVSLAAGAHAGAGAPHLQLRSSQPAAGDTLAGAPVRIVLEFTQGVSPATSEVRLVRADGSAMVLSLAGDSASERILVAALPPLASGAYRAEWRVISPDGHPVSGDIVFYVAQPGVAASPAQFELPPATERLTGEQVPLGAAALRGLAAAAQLGLAGVLGFLIWIGGDPRLRRVAVVLAAAAPFLIAGHVAAWITYVGPSDAGGGPWLWATLTGPGRFELVRLGTALLALWALGLAHMPGLAFAFAATSALAGAFIGHAMSFDAVWNVPAKGVHLIAVGAWLGGLVVVAFSDRSAVNYPERARRVSNVALGAVAAVAVTGIVQTLAIVPQISLWIGSRYGAFVLAKIAGLIGLIAFGAYHRFRVLPTLDATGGSLRRSVGRELALMGVVIVLASILGYVSPPEPASDLAATSHAQVHEP